MVQKSNNDAFDVVIGNFPSVLDETADAFDFYLKAGSHLWDTQFDGSGSTADGTISGDPRSIAMVDPNDYEDFADNYDACLGSPELPGLSDFG